MTLLQAVILSLLEGLTEFLPISSTGHLLLAERYLSIPSTNFSKSFTIIVQLAAILAIIWLFRKRVFSALFLWKQILIAFIPTGFIGLISYGLVKNVFFESSVLIILSLFFGGLILLIIDRLPKLKGGKKEIDTLSVSHLFVIGLFQSLSIIPGVSRSAASIIGGLTTGLSRVNAVEFSFLLAIPTMVAASGLDFLKTSSSFTPYEYQLLVIGSLISFTSALIAVKFFINYVKNKDFTIFAVYRILLSFILILNLIF